MSELFANFAISALAADIDEASTTITVIDASSFPPSGDFRITIELEICMVTGVSGSDFTVERGIEGTTPAVHLTNTVVYHTVTAGALEALGGGSVTGNPNDIATFDDDGNITSDDNLKWSPPDTGRTSNAVDINRPATAPTDKGLYIAVYTDDTDTEKSGIEVARISNGEIDSDLFSTGISGAIGAEGALEPVQLGALTWRRDGATDSGKLVLLLTDEGTVRTLLSLTRKGNLVPTPATDGYGIGLATVDPDTVVDPPEGALVTFDGKPYVYTGTEFDNLLRSIDDIRPITFGFDGGSAGVIPANTYSTFAVVEHDCTITLASMYADVSCTAVVQIRAASYSAFPMLSTIYNLTPPTITAGYKSQDATLSGWTVDLPAGTIMQAVVSSNNNARKLTAVLTVVRQRGT